MEKRLILWLFFIFGAGVTVAYQGCGYESASTSESSSKTDTSNGGEGFDGKPYISNGTCDATIGIKSKIVISSDNKSAALTRENCLDLAVPKAVPIEELKFSESDSTTFAYNNQVFDLQTDSSSQRTTLHLCRSETAIPSVEALIWRTAVSGGFYGSVVESDGSFSGPIEVLPPSSGPSLTYTSAAGQSAEFDLSLSDPTSGVLSYTLWGEAKNRNVKMTCLAQPPSSALVLVKEFIANVQGSGTTWSFDIFSPTLAGNLLVIGLTRRNTPLGSALLGCVAGIQDNAGNVYVMAGPEAIDSQAGTTEVWYAANSKAQGSIVTITLASTAGCANRQPVVNFVEFLGVATSNPVESYAILSNQPSSTLIKAPAISTSAASTLIFSVANAQHELLRITAGNPFTLLQPGNGDASAYLFSNSAGTYEAVWDPTNPGTYSSVSVSFKSAW